jgi:agmatinase
MARNQERLNLPPVGIPSFCRSPICQDLDTLDADIAILGIPFDEGVPHRPGTRLGPRSIRDMSMRLVPKGGGGYFDIETRKSLLENEIRERRIWDCGDVDILYTKVLETFENVTDDVHSILSRGAFPVILGGDHSITFPVVRAYATHPIDIVMLDGHLDFSDHRAGVTHASAMPFRRCAELPNIRKIVQIGMRGVRNSRQDYEAAVANGNVIITARELHKQGVAASLERALPLDNVYFSIDIDGMDVAIAPGCGGQEPGGLTYEETLEIFGIVTAHAPVIGFDITEVNPLLDVGDVTSVLASNLIIQFLGMATAAGHWPHRKLEPAVRRAGASRC